MQKRSRVKTFILLMALCGLLLAMVNIAMAQDGETAEEIEAEETTPGIGTGVLLVGLVAVLAVGGMVLFRENYTSPTLQSPTE